MAFKETEKISPFEKKIWLSSPTIEQQKAADLGKLVQSRAQDSGNRSSVLARLQEKKAEVAELNKQRAKSERTKGQER